MDQKLQNFINTIPRDILESEEAQEMALDSYYSSVNNVLHNELPSPDVMELLQKTKEAGGSMLILRDKIENFDEKVFMEFSKLIKENMGYLDE